MPPELQSGLLPTILLAEESLEVTLAYYGFYARWLRGGPGQSVGNSGVILTVAFGVLPPDVYCDSGKAAGLQSLQGLISESAGGT